MRSTARLAAAHRLGVLALASLGGAVLGLMGSFTHQSLQPWGVAIALITVALYLSGLRVWAGDRGPASLAAAGIAAVSGFLAMPDAGGSVVIPANFAGYTWTLGVVLIALLVLAWPRVQRPPRRAAGSIEVPASEEKDATAL